MIYNTSYYGNSENLGFGYSFVESEMKGSHIVFKINIQLVKEHI